MEDRELQTWQKEWRNATEPLPEIQKKIKRQNRGFVLGNTGAALAFFGGLALSVVAVRQEPSPERIAWAVGIWVLAFVSGGYRLWNQRGTWRAATQSTRAFVELAHKRTVAKLRSIRFSFYAIGAWAIFCAVLTAWRWNALFPEFHAHLAEYVGALGGSLLMFVAAFLYLAWYQRRKTTELEQTKRILEAMKE
jgi:hypothetical protein